MKMSLVLQLARLGDLLQTKRLLLTLAAEGETHLVVDASLAPLAALLYPGVEVHALPAHAGGLDAAGVLRLACKACAELSALPCDKVYNLNRSPLNLALAGLFAPEKVVGYRLENGQALASTWACMAARWTGKRRISPLNLMDFWAFFHPSPWPADQVNPEAKAKSPSGYAGQRVGVALAGREARRSLPPPVLAETLKMVFAQYKGPTLVLLGGETEQAKARLLLKCLPPAMQSKTENLCGKTALTDLPGVIQSMDLLLAPDTGLMHLAAHLGTPVLAFFLASAWAWETGPYGMGHKVWQSVPPCAPCLESRPCPHRQVCLEPFKSAAWIARLRGRPGETAIQAPLLLSSSLDALGLTFTPSLQDAVWEKTAEGDERHARRALLAEYLGVESFDRKSPIPAELSSELLEEKDWMLPEYGAV